MLHLHQKPVQQFSQKFQVEPLIKLQKSLWPTPTNRQLSLTHPVGITGGERYLFGNGSLTASWTTQKDKEWRFTEFVEELKTEYVYQVYQEICKIAASFEMGVGRVRYMLMPPISCLSYHKDVEPFRFHIPLYTNGSAMFIVDDQVAKMPEVGRLYALRTEALHTAINAHRTESRLHLVFCTYMLSDKYTTTN